DRVAGGLRSGQHRVVKRDEAAGHAGPGLATLVRQRHGDVRDRRPGVAREQGEAQRLASAAPPHYFAAPPGFRRAASLSRPALAANADASMPRSFFSARSAPAASSASTASS